MKKFLYDAMFPDYTKMDRRDWFLALGYILTLAILFATNLSLAIIIAVAILLPAVYLTLEILAIRHQRKTGNTNI